VSEDQTGQPNVVARDCVVGFYYDLYDVEGDNLLTKIKEIIHEGNVRRIIIKNEEGKQLIEVPLTVGVVGAVLLPVWAAIGVIAAIVTSASIEVERAAD